MNQEKKRGVQTISRLCTLSLLFFVLAPFFVSADALYAENGHDHEEQDHGVVEENMVGYFSNLSLHFTYIAALIVLVVVFLSVRYEKAMEPYKTILFLAITIPTLIASVFLIGSTIYLNVISETGGPVHWHADFEIWHCGEKLDLIDPTGLSNRVGTPVFHEHGDDRIHVEGVVVKYPDVSLSQFFSVVGSSLTQDSFTLLTDEGFVTLHNGDLCDGEEGTLQVFLYSVQDAENKPWTYTQEKLGNFMSYVLAPHTYVPPGDCLIIEFGEQKEQTEHLCETYKTAQLKGDLHGS